ncbi:pms1 protein-like protein 1 [Plakobranchus ocellatus]|uniref:Pms1 protein-like protein 1 n=1 Tax=Plakobranchus ocellatus TaxID=259542 RepID=A0AAV4E1L0_9GAST|nr:pms1 protein-like protein 1 [Plakobranchus ocellatus]
MAGLRVELKELPSSTIRLIGSGQVITSVFSVVKELFENSVDASSTIIDIKLDDYGLERIEVCDNGIGVRTTDVSYMTKRHFTSKLSHMDDLLSLETYGFRGEALASLCAVSDVTVVTKTKDDEVSTAYTFDSEGNVISSKPSHLGTGTTVTARHLFKNLPVRKQYYKTSQRRKEDLRKIEDLLVAFSIIKPNLRLTLKHGSDVIFQKLHMPDCISTLDSVLGRHISKQLLFREQSLSDIQCSVFAFLPKPGTEVKTMSRASSDRTFVVINDRPVDVKEILRLLKRYYVNCHACESSRYPVCYISIKLPIPDVDVNIDPNKTTVFLRPMSEVCNTLEEILLQVYGPLDNVRPWHYSEATKNKMIETNNDSKFCSKTSMMDIDNNNEKLSRTVNDLINNGNGNRTSLNFGKELNSNCPQESEECSNLDVHTSIKRAVVTYSMEQENNEVDIQYEPQTDAIVDDLQSAKTHCEASAGLQPISCSSSAAEKSLNILEEAPLSSETTLIEDTANSKEDLEKDNVEPLDKSLCHASEWSKGCLIVDTSGQNMQPVQLLAPTSKHTPGKRPLSPLSQEINKPAVKQRPPSSTSTPWPIFFSSKRPPTDQPTLPGMVISPAVQVSSSSLGSHNRKDDASMSTSNKEMSTVQHMKVSEPSKNNKQSKTCLRDQVAAQASQSQAERPKKTLRMRLYHEEKRLHCALEALGRATTERETHQDRLFFAKPLVLGHADQCDAWFCCFGSDLGVINIHRLTESILYQKLRKKHILPTTPLEQTVALNARNLSSTQIMELERLSQECQVKGTFEITDDRLVANGFDVKISFDSDGAFSLELFGICNLIPTYGVDDLGEVLDKLIQEPTLDLASARPTKVLYYLQGEAARMAQQNSNLKTMQEVQELLDQVEWDLLKKEKCIHHKPLFVDLFSLNNLCLHDSSDDD